MEIISPLRNGRDGGDLTCEQMHGSVLVACEI